MNDFSGEVLPNYFPWVVTIYLHLSWKLVCRYDCVFQSFLSETFRAGIGRFTPIAITCSSIKFTPRYPSLWSRRIKIPARRHHQSMKNKWSRVINHTAVRSLRTIVSIDNEYIELNIDLQLVRHLLSSPLVAIHFFVSE